MIKLIDILKEVLVEIGEGTAKPFPWKYRKDLDDMGGFKYRFKTDDGIRYDVDITFDDNNQWEVGFSARMSKSSNNSYTVLTGVGALRVMATVTQIIKDFLTNTYTKHIEDKDLYGDTYPKEILFSAKKEEESSDDGKRANLYKIFIQKQLPGAVVTIVRSMSDQTWYSIKIPASLRPKKLRK